MEDEVIVCTTCETSKDESEYYYFNGRPNGKKCKECVKAWHRKDGQARRSIHCARLRIYRLTHSDSVSDAKKRCYECKKSHYILKAQQWAEKNKDKRKVIANRWAERSRRNISDNYAAGLLVKGSCVLRIADLPMKLVGAKKAEIQLRRALK